MRKKEMRGGEGGEREKIMQFGDSGIRADKRREDFLLVFLE